MIYAPWNLYTKSYDIIITRSCKEWLPYISVIQIDGVYMPKGPWFHSNHNCNLIQLALTSQPPYPIEKEQYFETGDFLIIGYEKKKNVIFLVSVYMWFEKFVITP